MSLRKKISDITECSICNEPFVDPKVLPCVHTFCLKCLESYGKSRIASGISLNCPICRAKFKLPSNKFTDLPGNFFIQKLLEINKIAGGADSNECDGCCGQNDTARSATSYCLDCRQSFCDQCCHAHNRMRYNKNHKVVEFGKKEADELLKVSPTFCEKHQDEVVKLFCSDCKVTICMICYVEKHKTHDCSDVLKVSEGFLQNLKKDAVKVAEHIATCLNENEKLQRKKSNFLQHIKEQQLAVLEMVKKLHGLVDMYGNQLFTELQFIKRRKLNEFDTTYNELQDRLVIMESFNKYSEEIMAKATPADIIRHTEMLKKRASELHSMRLDNDFLEFDVGITPSKLESLLMSKSENPVGDLAVWSNRRENVKAFPSNYTTCLLPALNKKLVYEMTNIGQELYVLNKGTPVNSGDRLIGAKVLKLALPQTYPCPTGTYYMTNFTRCDAVIIHLQLWLRNSGTGQTMQLQMLDLNLVESDGVFEASTTFELHSHQDRQPSSINQNISLKAPQKLNGGYIFGFNINVQMTGTVPSVTFQTSVSVNSQNIAYQDMSSINIPLGAASTTDSSFVLDVYDTKVGSKKDSPKCNSASIRGMILRLKLPDNFVNKDGASVARTNYTQSDCVLIFLQLNHNEMSSAGNKDNLQLQISKLSLSESGGSFVTVRTMKVPEIKLEEISDVNHNVTIKAPQKLKNNGFHGIDIRVKFHTTSDTITVKASVSNVSTTEESYPEESSINIPTMISKRPLKLRRTITLPSTLDPSGMASCSYYQCIYIGDRHSTCVYRFESTGKQITWSVGDVPDGLSVTPSHTLIITIKSTSELKEYDTCGDLLRQIQLNGLENPTFSAQLTENRFIVTTGESSACAYLATVLESKTAAGKTDKADVKEMVLFADNTVTTDSGSLEKPDGTKNKAALDENEKSCVHLNGPVQLAVDRFGFVFILTVLHAKVHLLSPQLNYLGERILLNRYGIVKPSVLHFDDMSGILYVGSGTGPVTIMGFKVTEECIDSSEWKDCIII